MNGLIVAMMIFINAHTGLGVIPDGNLPYVEQLSHCDMVHIVEGASASCEIKDGQPYARAAYAPMLNRIYLPDDFDIKNILDLSILLHETTHAMQAASPLRVLMSCMDMETQAYSVQGEFLSTQGIDFTEVTGFKDAGEGARASCHVQEKTK